MNLPGAIRAYLPDSRNTRLNPKTLAIQIIINIPHDEFHLRPRPDQTHCPFQNIEKLRQLIQACFSQQSSNPGNSGITARCRRIMKNRSIDEHGSKFIDRKGHPVFTDSCLLKQNRPLGVQLDQQGKAQPAW